MRVASLVVIAALVGTACAPALGATTDLRDKDGQSVGSATFAERSDGGVSVSITITKLPSGQHGWHIHTTGKCDGPDFASAGGHFNPETKQHGAQNPQGPHAGDLGNLTVGSDGKAKVEFVAKAVTLQEGRPSSLFKTDGTALVIHANADDEKTDPAGNSGARIACGVIKKS